MPTPVTDPNILAQLNGGGPVTDPEILDQLNGVTSTWDKAKDAYKSLGTGVMKGFTGAAAAGGQAANLEMNPFEPMNIPNEQQTQGIIEKNVTGPWHKPQSTPGRVAERAGEFIGNPASYIGPGGMPMKAATAALSGVGSSAGEAIGEKLGFPQIGSFAGALLGGAVPSAGAKAITPFASNASHAKDVAILEKEGIPLTAGDKSGNFNLRAAESELSPEVNEAQKKAFVQAAFNRVGEPVKDIRDVTGAGGAVDRMKQRIGTQFDNLQAHNRADIDPGLVQETLGIQKKYTGVPGLYGDETENAVKGALGRLSQVYSHNGGSLTGTQYREMRTEFNNAAMGAEGPKARALHEIVDALDNNMERTIGRTNPADAGKFAEARDAYKKALVLQRWGKSSEQTPAALRQAAAHVYGEGAYVTGKDPFSELADAAHHTIAPYRSSETARREFLSEAFTKPVAGLAGYLAGTHYGNPEMGVLAGLSAEQAGRLAGKPIARAALMNRPVQGYLGNQLLSREAQESVGAPLSVRLARALAQTQGQ